MPKSVKSAIAIVGLLLMAIPAWDVLDKRGIMTGSIFIGSWLIGAALVIYSVSRMLRDSHDAETLRAEIVTIRDEHGTQMRGLETRLNREAAEARAAHQRQYQVQSSELEDRLNRDHDQAVAILKTEFASRYGEQEQENIRLASLASLEILKCEAQGILHELKHLDHDHREE